MTKNKIELEERSCAVDPQQARFLLQQDRRSEEQAGKRQEHAADAVETAANCVIDNGFVKTLVIGTTTTRSRWIKKITPAEAGCSSGVIAVAQFENSAAQRCGRVPASATCAPDVAGCSRRPESCSFSAQGSGSTVVEQAGEGQDQRQRPGHADDGCSMVPGDARLGCNTCCCRCC
jgi:hypothetical protein